MQKRSWILVGSGVLLAMAALAWAFAPRPVPVESARVERGRFEQSIEEDGRSRLRDVYAVSTPVAARLIRMTLREGDLVAAGDPVATLMPVVPPLQDARSVLAAQARLRSARAATAAARAQWERARVSHTQARTQKERSEQLAREGFIAAASVDNDRLALEAAQRDVQAAQALYDAAVQDAAQAQAALAPSSLVATTAPWVLRAPVSGTVLRVPTPSETTLAAGARVIDIGDPSRMEVVTALLTTDAMTTRPGAAAVIERWGGPPLPARVRRIEPAAFTQISALGVEEQRVHVLLDVQQPPPEWARMGDGFRVTVRILTTSSEDAVLAPVGALVPQPEGAFAVYRLVGGRARLQTVQLGGRNTRLTWVRAGLEAGEDVIVYPPPGVIDGARVRVRSP